MKKSWQITLVQGVYFLFIAFISCKEVSKKPEQQIQQVNIPKTNRESIPYTNTTVRTFEGAWFTIKYPSDFTVRSSMRSLSSADGYDSAFFLSPDSLVEFYIFSPQWNGHPSDIEIRPQSEYLIDSDIRQFNDRTETLYTIAAKDGSYKRSYREVKQYESSVNWVLGIKYSSERAYQKYQQAYVRFKKSLEQYTDGYPG